MHENSPTAECVTWGRLWAWFRPQTACVKTLIVIGLIIMLTSTGPHNEVERPWQMFAGWFVVCSAIRYPRILSRLRTL